MAITLIDQDVRERIQTDLATNLCVEASAGTGKTTVLVARIVEILRRGHTSIEKLAVITFTEKAAAELSARVREGLEKALECAEDSGEKERIETALRQLNRARIETIHAFASSLLKERPVEAGLDPNFEVLDALGSSLSFEEAYRSWLSQTLAGESPELWRAFNRGFELNRLRELAELLHSNRSLLPLPREEAPSPSSTQFVKEIADSVDDLRRLLVDCGDRSDAGAQQIERILSRFADWQQLVDRAETLDRELLKPITVKAAGNKKNWSPGESCTQQKEICTKIKERLQAIQDALRTSALVDILPLVEDFVLQYAERRRQAGTAEFDDLLIWSRDLLRDQSEVRAYFQERFTCILVDEFQDTDPLQVEIVLYLTSGEQMTVDWRQLHPLPGRLFVVGDPKQSIYRFRRADIAIYEWVTTRVLADGLLRIKQNFRSVPGVIGWVNDVFGQLIQEAEGIQPAYSDLVSARSDHRSGHPSVVLIHGEAEHADEQREEEARLLAGAIERLVNKEHWIVDEKNVGRPALWRDVAILLPSRTGIEHYERALAARDIPFRHEGGRSFFDRQEVRELISCLRAIDDPTDRLSLVAALRSGAFGCSDDQLYRFVRGNGKLDIRIPPDVQVPEVNEALATLRRLHDRRGRVTLPRFIGEVLEETRLVEYAVTLPQGQQAAANLLKVVDQARAFSGVRGGGLRAFVRWLATSSGGHADEADAAVAESRDDVVRILTIHGAKGLEFPIVALANLNSERTSRGSIAIPDPKSGRLAVSIGTRGHEFQTPNFDEDLEREKLHDEAEQGRLLYVAATRARDYLILPAVRKGDKSKGMLGALLNCLSPDGGVTIEARNMHIYDTSLISDDPPPPATPNPVEADEIDRWEANRSAWIEERQALIRQASRGLPLTLLDELDISPSDGDDGEDGDRLERGPSDNEHALENALRWVLTRADLEGANLERVCERVPERNWPAVATDELVSLARRCLEMPVMERARASTDVQRGAEFSAPSPSGGFVEGRVDVLFVEDDELVLVDFHVDEFDVAESRRRADRLAISIAAATSMQVKEVCLVFARTNVERTINTGKNDHT